MHVQKVFFKRGGIVLCCLGISLGGAATLFGKALVCGREGAAFTMCVDAWADYLL